MIFCTIVLGIGSIAKAATVGKVGGLALVYFMIMSTFALAIGLVVGNIIHPGEGLQPAGLDLRGAEPAEAADDSTGVPARHHPDDAVLRLHRRERAADAVRRAAGRASPCRRWARRASRSCTAVGHLQALVFRILVMIMWLAPVGAFGAIAAVVGATGVAAIFSLGMLMIAFYITCALFIVVILGALLKAGRRHQHLPPHEVPGAASTC